MKLLDTSDGLFTINLGLGHGQSVREVISEYEHVAGKTIPQSIVSKRLGDVGVSFANIDSAIQLIEWRPKKTLSDMCLDSYRLLIAGVEPTKSTKVIKRS